MSDTGIEWCDKTWNVTAGCNAVSPGCANCYAARWSRRIGESAKTRKEFRTVERTAADVYKTVVDERGRWNGTIVVRSDTAGDPWRWKKPARIFVNSMSDLFHDKVPTLTQENVMYAAAENPRHTFIILTKRPENAASFIGSRYSHPIPNVIIGTSAENQDWYDRRWPNIGRLGAAGWTTVVSVEPLLDRISLTAPPVSGVGVPSWVIVGGETGPNYRPCDPSWIAELRDECERLGIPIFVKRLAGGSSPPPELLIRQYPKES